MREYLLDRILSCRALSDYRVSAIKHLDEIRKVLAQKEQRLEGFLDSVEKITLHPGPAHPSASPPTRVESLIKIANVKGELFLGADLAISYEGKAFEIPKGFESNGANVPAIFERLCEKKNFGTLAPLVHDYLYEHQGSIPDLRGQPIHFSRETSDALMYDLMIMDRVPEWKVSIAWHLVRAFGQRYWNKCEAVPELVNGSRAA